jgi:signal transduction histidine kinase
MRISLIMIIAMFGIFLTFAVYGVVTFDLSIQEMKKLLGTRNEGFSFNIMQDLDQYIDKRLNDFNEIIKQSIVQDALKESNKEFGKLSDVESFITEQDQSAPFLREVIDQDLTEELVNSIQFYKDEYGYDVVEELFITNAYGANVALGIGTSDYKQNDEEWWQITKNSGKYVGELQFVEKYGNYATEFGFRIDDENGNFLGVMKVVLTLDDMIHEFINDAELINIPNRNVVLLDRQGRIMYDQGIHDFPKNQPISYFERIVDGRDVGTLEFTNELGEVRLVSYAKSTGYKTFEGFDWIVLVDQISSSFVDEFVELRNSILMISLIGMIASVMIGIVTSFFITKPLKELSSLAMSISQGKFNVKIKKSRINEIEVIGNSFNEMSESLQKLIETEKQLAEAQVRIKNERLMTIGEIAASMAHNMKNPLGTIRSSADIVKRISKGTSKDVDEVLSRMDRAVERMSRQIEDVLDFVRVTPLSVSLVPLRTLLDGAIESIDIPKNIMIEISQTDLQLKCDSKKIEIVFINLILNAIQSIGNNQGKIYIRIRKDNGFAIIEIEDSGPGITEEILPKIFEPLVTTKEKGTGLGLSTCKNIVEQHGGTISARNNPTIFTVRLPIND